MEASARKPRCPKPGGKAFRERLLRSPAATPSWPWTGAGSNNSRTIATTNPTAPMTVVAGRQFQVEISHAVAAGKSIFPTSPEKL
jgi:hypothetical protein